MGFCKVVDNAGAGNLYFNTSNQLVYKIILYFLIISKNK